MKKLLLASLMSALSLAAVGCIDHDEPSVDPELVESIERQSGFDVILVDGPALPAALVDEDAETAVLGNAGPSDAPRAHVGGADDRSDFDGVSDELARTGYQPMSSSLAHAGYSEIRRPLARPGFEAIERDDRAGFSVDQIDAVPGLEATAGDAPADPCDCAGESCRRDWVDANLGCNVCAVFVCDGDNTPHACNACP